MTTQNETTPQTPPQGGAGETAEQPQVTTSPATSPAVAEPRTTATSQADEVVKAPAEREVPKPAAPAEPKRDYAAERKQERIDKLTAQKAELEREVAKLRSGQSADATRMQQEIAEKASKLASEEAAKIASWNTFTGALNAAIAEGQKELGAEKFDKSVQALRTLHDQTDPDTNQRYLNMLQAMLDTGAAPKLIAALGDDPNEAARIMGLSPTKMGVELGKLAFRGVEEVSGAPKPITPVSGVGRNHVAIAAEDPERSDSIDMRVWMERRGQHVNEVNKRAGRRVIP